MMRHPAWSHPCPDELLSSWLARVAVNGGCDPLSLTASIWPKWRVWTTDVDRSLSAPHTRALARWMQCDEAAVRSTTLLPYTAQIHGTQRHFPSTIPWLLARGCRNRSHFAGQPCCPACLQEDPQPYYRRCWRLAFVVGCEKHGVRLIDRCVACQALIMPHLCVARSASIGRCAVCGVSLGGPWRQNVQDQAMRFQHLAMSALLTGESPWQDSIIPAATWFSKVRQMLAPSRCPVALPQEQAGASLVTNLPLELQSIAEREARLCSLMALLETRSVRGRHKTVRNNGTSPSTQCSPSDGRALLHGRQNQVLLKQQSGHAIEEGVVRVQWARWLRRNRMW